MTTTCSDRFVSTGEAAKLLGISRDKMYEFIRRDENPIPHYQEKERGRKKFRVPEILDWYASNFRRV